jgi:hypothetical protein
VISAYTIEFFSIDFTVRSLLKNHITNYERRMRTVCVSGMLAHLLSELSVCEYQELRD